MKYPDAHSVIRIRIEIEDRSEACSQIVTEELGWTPDLANRPWCLGVHIGSAVEKLLNNDEDVKDCFGAFQDMVEDRLFRHRLDIGGIEESPKTKNSDTSPEFVAGTDITARLTTWCHAPQSDSAQDIMDEAAKEIERLRGVTEPMTKKKWAEVPLHLTDEEREAVDIACMNLAETVRRGRQKQDNYMQEGDLEGAKWTEEGVVSLVQARDTLRSLLERLK